MNQIFFIFNLTRPLRPWREQSLSQSRIKNQESKITSPSNPLLLLLTLSLLSSFTSFAWDDDDNDYGYKNPYQSRIQNPRESVSRERGEESKITPVNDYGYKNPYQANSTHRASAIDFGGPKRLAQANDDNDSKPLSQSSIQNNESKINYTSPHQAYEDNYSKPFSQSKIQHQESRITMTSADRESKEIMAESQRSFERQEAQQEKSRAQMAKQQEIYNKMDREEGEMAEFLGGVYKAKFGATTGHNSAITSDGYVFRSGNNFVTPKGIYTKTGNTYAGPGSFTTQTGTLFFGNESTTIQAGGAYFSEGKSGFIVSPNTSTWRTR